MAEDTCTPGALATWAEPTGSAVPMYSVDDRLEDGGAAVVQGALSPASSVVGVESAWVVMAGLALKSTECQGSWRRGPAPGGESQPAGVPARAARQSSPRRSAEMKASWGTSTRPMVFIRFLPSFCRSSSLRLRVMSPP